MQRTETGQKIEKKASNPTKKGAEIGALSGAGLGLFAAIATGGATIPLMAVGAGIGAGTGAAVGAISKK